MTVFSSVNVELRCRIAQGIPFPTLMFFRNGTALDGTEDDMNITDVSVACK